MKRWPIKLKVSVFCAVLTVAGLLGAAAVILPYIYMRQIEELDDDLRRDTEGFIEELETHLGPSPQWSEPLSTRMIPAAFRRRYITIEIEGGPELFRSPQSSLRGVDLKPLGLGSATIEVPDRTVTPAIPRNCRFYSVQKGPVIVRMGTRLGTIEAMQQDLLAGFKIVLPIFGAVVFLGTILLAHRALRPVSAITSAAERISAESPDERLPVPRTNDEIARLTIVLNESFDRLQRAYQSAAHFSADASHQLKTPIAVLRAGLDELRLCDYLKPEDREIVDVLLRQTRRLTTLVEDLLLLAQADAGRLQLQPAPVDLAPIIATTLDDVEALGIEKNLQIQRDTPATLIAKADMRRVKIILQNLGENAVKYNRDHGRIRITARNDGKWIAIAVANTGHPIPEEFRDRLFERFNRAGMGENIKGHGLGLNIARELARAHGGELALTRSDSEWTEFTLRLPAGEMEQPPLPRTALTAA